MDRYKEFVFEKLDLRTLLEQTAEEACELSQASLKMIRTIYAGNPTPVNQTEALANLKEEIGDVEMLIELLELKFFKTSKHSTTENPKWRRWAERLGFKDE